MVSDNGHFHFHLAQPRNLTQLKPILNTRSSIEPNVCQRCGSRMSEFTNYAAYGVIPWLLLSPFQVRGPSREVPTRSDEYLVWLRYLRAESDPHGYGLLQYNRSP